MSASSVTHAAPLATRAASILAAVVGSAAIVGWTFAIPALKSVVPGFTAMQPWTAVAILLGAVGLWLAGSAEPAAQTVSILPAIALVFVVGAPLFENATGSNLGTDLLLFANTLVSGQPDPYPNPGRISPLPSTALAAFAAALVLAPRVSERAGRVAFSALASIGLALTLASVLGYILRLESLADVLKHNHMAIPTRWLWRRSAWARSRCAWTPAGWELSPNKETRGASPSGCWLALCCCSRSAPRPR